MDAQKGPSYQVNETAFQDAVGTSKPIWEWLEEKVPARELKSGSSGYPGVPSQHLQPPSDEEAQVSRPELSIAGLAMAGIGGVNGIAHVHGTVKQIMILKCSYKPADKSQTTTGHHWVML